MPIWMLVVFAICMFSCVLSFGAIETTSPIPTLTFFVSLAMFFIGIGTQGIRRPVV